MSRKVEPRFFEHDCPDCQENYERNRRKKQQWACGCDLTKAEHKRMRKLRAQAEKQAHQLAVQARERELLPRALIKEGGHCQITTVGNPLLFRFGH